MLDSTSASMPFALRARAVIDRVDEFSRIQKRILVGAGDAVLCVLAVWFAYFLRLNEWRLFTEDVAKLAAGALVFWFAAALATGVYREFFRFSGSGTMMRIAGAIGIMLVPMVTVFLIVLIPGVPRTLAVLQPIIFFLLLVLSRIMIRYIIMDLAAVSGFRGKTRRILIYGAGAPGMRLASSMRHEPGLRIEGYVDDDALMRGQRLDRLKVYHSGDLTRLVRDKAITDIYLALPRLTHSAKQRIMESLGEQPVQIMALPNVRDIIEGGVSINEFREIDISDLLGRSPIAPDQRLMTQTITGKTVMVSGAGGSIGSELCNQIARLSPSKLVLVELSEFALYSVDNAIRDLVKSIRADFEIVPELCNISDRASINRILQRHNPDTVFHAAAYKHVPLVEANVIGGARNNIIGTLNIMQAALNREVSNFILISTDKAVRPTNIMGATCPSSEHLAQITV